MRISDLEFRRVLFRSRYIRIYGATDPNIADSISQKGFGIVNARIHWCDPLGHEGITDSIFARHLFEKISGTSATRTEERRVRKDGVSTCRSRCSPDPEKKHSSIIYYNVQQLKLNTKSL